MQLVGAGQRVVAKMAAWRYAELGDLCPATRMARQPTNARICRIECVDRHACLLCLKVAVEPEARCCKEKKSSADELAEPAYELDVRSSWQPQRNGNILQPILHLLNIMNYSAKNPRHSDAHSAEEEQ